MRGLIQRVHNTITGRKFGQNFYEKMFRFSLMGMNYGNGGNFKESGEIKILEYINSRLKGEDKLTVFDVGANIGGYTQALNEFFGKRADIHAFEPSRKTYDRMLQNVADIPNLQVNNVGLSNEVSEKVLYMNNVGSGMASVYDRKMDHFGIDMSIKEDIFLTTLDTYCKEKKIPRVHFLKLDIEGHEMQALEGAKEMLEKGKVDFIQFEFGGCNIDSRTYFQDFFYFFKDDFNLYRILRDGLQPIPEYKETQEVFITINYLAERKTLK